jgi:hypothetical protein
MDEVGRSRRRDDRHDHQRNHDDGRSPQPFRDRGRRRHRNPVGARRPPTRSPAAPAGSPARNWAPPSPPSTSDNASTPPPGPGSSSPPSRSRSSGRTSRSSRKPPPPSTRKSARNRASGPNEPLNLGGANVVGYHIDSYSPDAATVAVFTAYDDRSQLSSFRNATLSLPTGTTIAGYQAGSPPGMSTDSTHAFCNAPLRAGERR